MNPGPCIVFINEAVTRISGYTPEELLGHSPRMLQGPGTDAAARQRLRNSLAAGQPCREVLLNYRKDGTPFWSELDIVPLAFEEDGETYFAAVQRDITEQRAREERLKRLYLSLEDVREEERKRIARDLHDELGQILSAIKLDIGALRREEMPERQEPLSVTWSPWWMAPSSRCAGSPGTCGPACWMTWG